MMNGVFYGSFSINYRITGIAAPSYDLIEKHQTLNGHFEKLRPTKSLPKRFKWLQLGILQKLEFFEVP